MGSGEYAHNEPVLAEVIRDPIVLALMQYDAVEEKDISALVRKLEDEAGNA